MTSLLEEASHLLHQEAWFLDNRAWNDWLTLYTDDCIFWAPAMVGDENWTDNPDNDVSLIYMDRPGLEARIFRIEGQDSYATHPLPHTSHLVTNILVQGDAEDKIDVSAAWMVRSYSRAHGSLIRGGLYHYVIRKTLPGLKILKKKIFVHDDKIVGPIDIYNI